MIFLKKPTDTFQCAIYSVKFFAEKKKWHMHCSYERDTVSSPSFHYMQLVNASTPKALLFSLLPSPPPFPRAIPQAFELLWIGSSKFLVPLPNHRITVALKCAIQWLHLLFKRSS